MNISSIESGTWLLRGQQIIDLIAAAARPHHGAHISRVDRHRVEARDVEEHAAVAHMIARPAMPA